jgi:hypothetical protein
MSYDIIYYKIKLAEQIRDNPAFDPIYIYRTEYNLPELRAREPPLFTDLPSQNNNSTQYEFTHKDVEGYLRGDKESVEKAVIDNHRLFEKYYLPILINQEAYKLMGTRKDKFFGGWNLSYEDDNIVAYENKQLNKNYIGIRGTRITSPQDLFSDLNILGNALAGESLILHGLDDIIKKQILDLDKNKKWIITGHSKGATQSNIIQNKYPNQINQAYLFNMGMSPIPLAGWKPYKSDNSLHYHISQDIISAPFIGDRMKTMNISALGRGRLNVLERSGNVMYGGSLLYQPQYHSLDTFLNTGIANKVNQYTKINNHILSNRKIKGQQTKQRKQELLVKAMTTKEKIDFINNYTNLKHIELFNESELDTLALQLLMINKEPKLSASLREVKNKEKELKELLEKKPKKDELAFKPVILRGKKDTKQLTLEQFGIM